jgi:hypothetical protein
MKKVLFFILFAGFLSFSYNALAGSKKDITGTWKCYMADAPSDYQNFKLVISGSPDNYTGNLISEGGYEIPLSSIAYKNGKLEIKLSVQYVAVTVTGKVKGKKIKGMVNSTEGEWKVVGTKEIK